VPDLYTGDEYARRHPGWHREHSDWKAAQVLAMLRRRRLAPRTVVEIGCGAGGILAALQRALPPATEFSGYEIAPAAFAMAQPLTNDKLRFVLGDFLAMETPRGDLLLAMDVVEHIDDHLGFLRALRPRAAAHIFHLPLDLCLLSELQPRRLQWAKESVGHLHYFTKNSALATLRATGYTVTDWFFTAVELDLPPPSGQQQRMRALRRLGRKLSPALTSRILGGFSVLVLCE